MQIASNLTDLERKELRKQRFKSGKDTLSLLELKASADLNKQKLLDRAHKFGLESKVVIDEKKKKRALKFGTEIKSTDNGIRKVTKMPSEDNNKRQKRIERFGKVKR